MGIVAKAEGLANRVITWLTLFGFLSAGLAWLSSKLTSMEGYGWADFAAAGILGAVLVTLAIAAILVAWRLFRPLPRSPDTAPEESRTFLSPASELGSLEGTMNEKIGELDRKIQGRLGDLLTEIQRTDLVVNRDNEKHAGATAILSAGVSGLKQDVTRLFQLAASQSTIRLLETILAEYPKFDGKLIDQASDMAVRWGSLKDFIETCRVKTNGTIYQEKVVNIIRNLEKGTGDQIDATPLEKRPASIDHLVWRKLEITEAQAQYLKKFFEGERWQMIEGVVSQQREIMNWLYKDH